MREAAGAIPAESIQPFSAKRAKGFDPKTDDGSAKSFPLNAQKGWRKRVGAKGLVENIIKQTKLKKNNGPVAQSG